jgi:hypothetical protein
MRHQKLHVTLQPSGMLNRGPVSLDLNTITSKDGRIQYPIGHVSENRKSGLCCACMVHSESTFLKRMSIHSYRIPHIAPSYLNPQMTFPLLPLILSSHAHVVDGVLESRFGCSTLSAVPRVNSHPKYK